MTSANVVTSSFIVTYILLLLQERERDKILSYSLTIDGLKEGSDIADLIILDKYRLFSKNISAI
jgi:hypothetical protein